MIRFSRSCYDKPWRCPGWIGGGLRYPKGPHRCNNGRIQGWDGRYEHPQWYFHRCDTCNVITWPYVTRWVDPTWWISMTRVNVGRWYRELVWWLHERTEDTYWLLNDHYADLTGARQQPPDEE